MEGVSVQSVLQCEQLQGFVFWLVVFFVVVYGSHCNLCMLFLIFKQLYTTRSIL